MGKLAFSRNLAPIGGADGREVLPASCRAGQRYRVAVVGAVMRIAWSTYPRFTSSQRSRPGRIGSPAASADVQPAGLSRSLRSDHVAPEPAVQPLLVSRVFHVSYSRQVALSTTMACRSPPALRPPSIFVSGPSGYRTRSLSDAYSKRT